MTPPILWVNLGGEGEVAGCINQQGPWVILDANWRGAYGQRFADLVQSGHTFLICPNDALAFPDGTVDVVITNHVSIDINTQLGRGVLSSEIQRILKAGGIWIHNGVLHYTKP
jgi:hypothetical protein